MKLAAGAYRDTRHAAQRKSERDITLGEVREAVEAGWHEARKDEYRAEYKAWNYSLRGRTLDDRDLRVIVSFDEEDDVLIITTVDLST
jgi:hypothetical protein